MTVPPVLHELEAEVMDEVWRQGETSVRLVMQALNGRTSRARAYTTYMTVMRRLDDKGLLERTRSGRHDTYVPRITREEYEQRRAEAEVESLIERYGDVALAHFVKSVGGLDPARRRALRKLAEGG
jgi:predicted transcriptional regulator